MTFVPSPRDATGFGVAVGERVRVVAWLPAEALRVLPWEAPGTAEITAALSPGLSDLRLTMPWNDAPDWGQAPGIPADAFVVRAEGVAASPHLPASIPLGAHALHIAAIWHEPVSLPAPAPPASQSPQDPPSAPDPSPTSPPAPRPTPFPRTPSPEPLPPPRLPHSSRGRGALPWLLGLGAIVATITFVRVPRRRSL